MITRISFNKMNSSMKVHKRTNSKHSLLIPSPLNALLHSDKHIKYHFYSLGGDFIRLGSYRKIKTLFTFNNHTFGNGSLIKEIVYDLSTFLKRELNDEKSTKHLQLKNFLTSNQIILNKENSMILCDHHFGLKNWLYIIFGYMIHNYNEDDVYSCLEYVIEMYLESRKTRLRISEMKLIRDSRDYYTLETFNEYIKNVKIKEDLLFESNDYDRFVSFTEAFNKKIYLPKLPKLNNKELLVKALMHKEFYRLLLDPNHSFAKKMKAEHYDLDFSEYGIIRREISFLDGLGDLFLAQETSKLIFDLCNDGIDLNSTTYQLLRMILATNTLMSKLAKCYKLYEALDDSIINTRISNEYLPYTIHNKIPSDKEEDEMRIYEEEFLGDFFESYMAALLIEQPKIAKEFIREIYKRILSVITETLPPEVTYQSWTIQILGRNIYSKKATI
ncbi:unnamed protein product [Candida verbasci]|uniref:RNase III domain-containing protein n=1 Tax=Candida verbasci TaxID=1227364 RepID=A0A9W4TWR0_9ASCO|nr:unnamed protein product [Candida verbasci]